MTLRKRADPKWLPVTFIGLVLLLVQPGITSAADLQQDSTSLIRGANSWAQNCARCHNMRDTRELSDAQWRVSVTHMRVRAGLTGQEARDIILFLQESN